MLTQKICALIAESKNYYIKTGDEAKSIKDLVETKIISDWEKNDNPGHFKVIRDNILEGRCDPVSLLKLYKEILEAGGAIEYRENKQYRELCLSGIAQKTNKKLEVYNPIYQVIFDQNWVKQKLSFLSKKSFIDKIYKGVVLANYYLKIPLNLSFQRTYNRKHNE